MVNEQSSWAITAGGCVKTVWARTSLKNVNFPQVLGCCFLPQIKRASGAQAPKWQMHKQNY